MIRISSYISDLYGVEKAKEIQEELEKYVETLPKERYRDEPLWYKSANLYLVYPDSIKGKKRPLQNLKDFLPHIKETGFSAVHILPFLDSPMMDRGYDVKDYFSVRKELGSMDDLVNLRKSAKKIGLRVFMDLVFNHVSSQHEWFQKALAGDKKYRNYFIHKKEKPDFIRKIHKNTTVWAEYRVDGEKKLVNIVFPEFAGRIPHWTHGKDDYWYYHTFRPDQLDLNWRNPDVFLECAKVLIFWARKGFHFRLDAISFVGKAAYKEVKNYTMITHVLLTALNHLAKQVNPECVFLVETDERIDKVVDYLGKKNLQQAEMLYGFQVCTILWLTLVTCDTRRLWKKLKEVGQIPAFGEWINFLRHHDELSLAYLDTTSLHAVRKALLPYGKSFREGYGIAGRTFSLLGEDKNRFLMAFLLLFSLPGGVLLLYGDEYGKRNTSPSHLTKEELEDVRNIGRGYLSKEFLEENKNSDIFQTMSHMMHVREEVRPYFNVWPQKQDSAESVFHGLYDVGNTHLRVLVNTTSEERIVSFSTKEYKKILSVNQVEEKEDSIILGPYGGVWLQK